MSQDFSLPEIVKHLQLAHAKAVKHLQLALAEAVKPAPDGRLFTTFQINFTGEQRAYIEGVTQLINLMLGQRDYARVIFHDGTSLIAEFSELPDILANKEYVRVEHVTMTVREYEDLPEYEG